MDNIERLKQYIDQVKRLIANTEERISAGAGWLDAQLGSLERHLDDLCKQFVEATKPKKGTVPAQIPSGHGIGKWKEFTNTKRSRQLEKAPCTFSVELGSVCPDFSLLADTDIRRLRERIEQLQLSKGGMSQKTVGKREAKSTFTYVKRSTAHIEYKSNYKVPQPIGCSGVK